MKRRFTEEQIIGILKQQEICLIPARSSLIWFPLHPLGYVKSVSYPMYSLWFSILLGWLCRVIIMRSAAGYWVFVRC